MFLDNKVVYHTFPKFNKKLGCELIIESDNGEYHYLLVLNGDVTVVLDKVSFLEVRELFGVK